MVWEPRTYRCAVGSRDLTAFEVVVAQTDLQILAARDLTAEAREAVVAVRGELEGYLAFHPRFAESFVPVEVDSTAPPIVREMAVGGRAAGVGPMAAVAGAIAERVAVELAAFSDEVIVENGGDIFLVGSRNRTVGLWSGPSAAGSVGLLIEGTSLPLAVATSSGRIGHSTSLGDADAVCVLARSGARADAAATAIANRVRAAADIESALAFARSVEGLSGVAITVDGAMGAVGSVHLVPIEAGRE